MANSCIVGIAGGSAAGKTSLTRALADFLKENGLSVEVLHGDAFYHADRSLGPHFVSPSQEQELFNFNHPDAIDQEKLVARLAECSRAENAPDVVLIEGLMVLHLERVREWLDIHLFVELEADVRAVRRLLRDMKGGRGSVDPTWIGAYYLECARVGHEAFVEPSRRHADFIVRGDADLGRLVPLLGGAISSRFHSEK